MSLNGKENRSLPPRFPGIIPNVIGWMGKTMPKVLLTYDMMQEFTRLSAIPQSFSQ